MNTTARSYYLCPLAAGEDNVTLSSLFTSFSGTAQLATASIITMITAPILVAWFDKRLKKRAPAAEPYIASEGSAWATIAGVSAELAAVVPSAAPSALFFFINTVFTAGLSGILLGIISALTGIVFYFIYNLFLKSGGIHVHRQRRISLGNHRRRQRRAGGGGS
jgi:ABC-type Co2+ transport system permease subunit